MHPQTRAMLTRFRVNIATKSRQNYGSGEDSAAHFNSTTLDTALSASNHTNMQGLVALKGSKTPAKPQEPHEQAAAGLPGWIGPNGSRATSHCNADASAFVARDACNCNWRSLCSLITKGTSRLRYDRCTGPGSASVRDKSRRTVNDLAFHAHRASSSSRPGGHPSITLLTAFRLPINSAP